MKAALCWFDIYADNSFRAKKFYEAFFGWEFRPFATQEGAMPEDWMIVHGEGQVGGMISRRRSTDAVSGQSPLLYFSVPSVEAALIRAESLGAKVIQPKTQISEHIGSFGIIQDTESNSIALFESV